jgi:hypothetical protein
VLGLGLLLLAGLSLWLAASRLAESPSVAVDPFAAGRLVAEQATIDLGRVPFDRLVEAHYVLANTGSSDVQLLGKPQVRLLEGC